MTGGDDLLTFDWDPDEAYDASGYTEFIEIGVDEKVYATAVEIGENRGMGAVVAVKAWDDATQSWGTLWSGDGDPRVEVSHRVRKQYRVFSAAPLCQVPFAADRYRVELDTRAVADWNEVDFVKVTGVAKRRLAGTYRSDQTFVYAPFDSFCGTDTFSFSATDCGFVAGRDSETTTASFAVSPVTDECGALESCPAGEYYDLSTKLCELCPVDTFAQGAGKRTACKPCASSGRSLGRPR